MAGGSLTVTVDDWAKMQAMLERLLCWLAAANRDKIQVQMSPGGRKFAARIPEESFGAGALVLKRAGTDLVSGYVAGTNIVYDAANGQAMSLAVNTCPSSAAQPTTTTATPVAVNVGGNPRAITLNYANVGGSGTVNIYWGDGTSNLAAAESGALAHTYPDTGTYKIRVEDVSVPTDAVEFWAKIPG
jgi:hypothetical protein